MEILITIGWIVVIATILLRSGMFVMVPTIHFGVVTRFGGRTGRVISEGLNIVLPFIDKVQLFSAELVTKSISGSAFSNDELEIVFKGSVQWRPDEKLLGTKFIAMDETTVMQGINDAVDNVLGIIAGTKKGDKFITERDAISLMINCMLRMYHPPHADLQSKHWLTHYIDAAVSIRNGLSEEESLSDDLSEIELRYGIDIVAFELSDVDFSPATKKAFELARQEKGKMDAVKLTHKTKLGLARDYGNKSGLDPKEAILAAETTMGQANRQIIDGNLGLGGAVVKKLITPN